MNFTFCSRKIHGFVSTKGELYNLSQFTKIDELEITFPELFQTPLILPLKRMSLRFLLDTCRKINFQVLLPGCAWPQDIVWSSWFSAVAQTSLMSTKWHYLWFICGSEEPQRWSATGAPLLGRKARELGVVQPGEKSRSRGIFSKGLEWQNKEEWLHSDRGQG